MQQKLIEKSNFYEWLRQVLRGAAFQCTRLAGDLSVRHYYRVSCSESCYILMDSSRQLQSCRAYVSVAQLFSQLDLCVPTIYAENLEQGFLLLADFGNQHYIDVLKPESVECLYAQAMQALHLLQTYPANNCDGYLWPCFDAALYQQELAGFSEWFVPHYCKTSTPLQPIFDLLIAEALNQPQVCTHRDYHSRNLMLLHDGRLGILDFQDARWGPICYDLVSLLRDCYIDWPPAQVLAWVKSFYQCAADQGRCQSGSFTAFVRGFDWVGLQRHLKCLGLFARLVIQEKRPQFAKYLPRVLNYALDVSRRYDELTPLAQLLGQASLLIANGN